MMPSKKKKYNARFPAGRIKKIMQTDEDVGKVAQAVPVIISRALELFVESLLSKAVQVTNSRNAKTLTPSHMRQCILSESRFDFLKDLVSNITEVVCDDDPGTPSGTPLTAYFPPVRKTESSRGRGRGRGLNGAAGVLRHRGSVSSQPPTPTTPVTPGYPSFYKEIPIGEESKGCQDAMNNRPPVIQHTSTSTSNNRPLLDDSGEEEDEDDTTNGYAELTNHNTRPLMIDDDYDT